MRVVSRSTVVIELAGHASLARDLSAGGVFVPACALQLTEECDLVVCGVTHQMSIPARVVYVDPRGAGLELLGFTPELKAMIAELASPAAEEAAPVSAVAPADDLEVPSHFAADDAAAIHDDDLEIPRSDDPAYIASAPPAEDLAVAARGHADGDAGAAYRADVDADDDRAGTDADGSTSRAGTEVDADDSRSLGAELDAELDASIDLSDLGEPDASSLELDLIDPDTGLALAPPEPTSANAEDDADPDDDADDGDDSPAGVERRARRAFARNVHERLRNLPLAAQIKLAGAGEMHERIVLERMYGKNVWETLLRNPRLTAPEVARIARMGALPRVLMEIIVANNAWLQIPEVRRALLANPRLGTDQIMKVLRVTPKPELKLATIQTAYPFAVRNAAKMLLRGD